MNVALLLKEYFGDVSSVSIDVPSLRMYLRQPLCRICNPTLYTIRICNPQTIFNNIRSNMFLDCKS